jgi:hypothetical protein
MIITIVVHNIELRNKPNYNYNNKVRKLTVRVHCTVHFKLTVSSMSSESDEDA